MANRKRPIILRCPVTAEERALIEQKLTQLQTKRIGAYLRKMAIDGSIIQVDTTDIKEMTRALSAIGRNINQIAKYARLYRGRYMIAAVEEEIYPSRPLMAQVADQLLTIRGVEASFVIAKTAKENDAVAVSSRSRGNVNVQTIMEKMKGGGHFTAAALQREHAQVADIEAELKQVLDAAEEEKSNEGNTAE